MNELLQSTTQLKSLRKDLKIAFGDGHRINPPALRRHPLLTKGGLGSGKLPIHSQGRHSAVRQ